MKWIVVLGALCAAGAGAWFVLENRQDDRPMHQQVSDVKVAEDRWLREDWEAAREKARAEKKPVLVLFRCVP